MENNIDFDYDFSGWVTRNDIRCSDGRTIRHNAFEGNDGQVVPLVWNHDHNNPNNVIGRALLENRPEGVYAYGKFNDTESGINTKELVQHGDVTSLSIFANHLEQNNGNVLHGDIREVSLVLAGANPGAYIDSVIAHSDENGDVTYIDSEEEATIYSGEFINTESGKLSHSDKEENMANKKPTQTNNSEVKSDDNRTIQDVIDSMTEEQKNVLYYLVGQALKGNDEDSEGNDEDSEGNKGDSEMKHNVFDNSDAYSGDDDELAISHSDLDKLCASAAHDARNFGGSFKDAFIAHANQDYGIGNVDLLFPDAKSINDQPEFIKREDAWVSDVMNTTNHTPFSRIKTLFADITADDARDKGYIKGNLKKEEFFALAKRETTPQTIYKKQKLDRDDITDASTIDVVAWLMTEMRLMLNEEIARAILIGDGRSASSPDKISEEHIRPVATMEDLFTTKEDMSDEVYADPESIVEFISKSQKDYKGSGNPVFYTTVEMHTNMLWIKDKMGRRIYDSDEQLCSALRVSKIVEVPVMDDYVINDNGAKYDCIGIKVNLKDYNVGTDKGGEINNFNDFDIDYNQYRYLMETRCSGSLVRAHSALVFRHKQSATASTGK